MREVEPGQGKGNRCIRTKAANALKLSQIPQKSLPTMQQLASTFSVASALNITASCFDEELILPNLTYWYKNTQQALAKCLVVLFKYIYIYIQIYVYIYFFRDPSPSTSIDARNLEAQLA